jgi:hypothetical protein
MEGKEERAMDEDESQQNSQAEVDKHEDREEQTSGTVWGHERLPVFPPENVGLTVVLS